MAEGVQKRLQGEIEKYKAVQKGNEIGIVHLQLLVKSGKPFGTGLCSVTH